MNTHAKPRCCGLFSLHAFLALVSIWGASLSPLPGQEIAFVEQFVLSENRDAELAKLVPGTEDYYFFHALDLQLDKKYDEVDSWIKTWINRNGYTPQVNQILMRQALLTYTQKPQKSIDFLTSKLNLNFDHQREIPTAEQNLSATLDDTVFDPAKLLDAALARSQLIDYVEPAAMSLLGQRFESLSPSQRFDFLSKLAYPDHPQLVSWIVGDMARNPNHRFGSLPIHQQLTLEQLEALSESRPELKNNATFIQLYLRKLRPSDDVAIDFNPALKVQYLLDIWQVLKGLEPSHNSLKANVLFHILRLEQKTGQMNLERFKAYLALPREVVYINPRINQERPSGDSTANLSADFSTVLRIPPVYDEQSLILDYLHHFLVDADSPAEFAEFFEETFLAKQFAKIKILNGLGNAETWAAQLSAAEYKALIEQVEITFAPTNPHRYGTDELVKLTVGLKNVNNLIVNIYEINTDNFYQQFNQHIDTNIKLDGLIPNWQQRHEFQTPPAIRTTRIFEFPELDHRGIFVVDFIGNGQSSRALINKGQIRAVSQITTAGIAVSAFDENGEQLSEASLWIGGRTFNALPNGQIIVPFSTNPNRNTAILRHGNFSALIPFQPQTESYELTASFFVDRESLIAGRKAKLLVRPILRASGTPVPLQEILEDATLTITSLNQDGRSTTRVLKDLSLVNSQEFSCEFQVPPRLASLNFELSAKVKNISQNRTDSLLTSRQLTINQIDKSDEISDLHLVLDEDNYMIEARGLSGELLPRQVIQLHFKHQLVREEIRQTLQTDNNGRIHLGQLSQIDSLRANLLGQSERTWKLAQLSQRTRPQTITGIAGKPVLIAAPEYLQKLSQDLIGFYELRDGIPRHDRYQNLELTDGLITASDLAAGDYRLVFKPSGESFSIHITSGVVVGGLIHGRDRTLEIGEVLPIILQEIETDETSITLTVDHARPTTRVHVIASRFFPRFNAFQWLNVKGNLEPAVHRHGTEFNSFTSGRKIGDEYRYILDRQAAEKFPGNMLQRPSLLLSPWSLGPTENRDQLLDQSDDFAAAAMPAPSDSSRSEAKEALGYQNTDFANLDFLDSGSVLLQNLPVDEDGHVIIDRALIGSHQHLTLVVVDVFTTLQRTAVLPLQPATLRDRTLITPLDPTAHVSQQKQIEIVPANQAFEINDILTAQFQLFADLEDVFRLMEVMAPEAGLTEWRFLLQWPTATEEEKQEWYSKYACHELNFFIWKKDRPFFDRVVMPFLENKYQKTFVDQWLLQQDLSEFLTPRAFAQLNTFEKTLLSQRLQGEGRQAILRHLQDQFATLPLDQGRRDSLFDMALNNVELGGNSQVDEIREKQRRQLEENSPKPQSNESGAQPQTRGRANFNQPAAPGIGSGGLGGMSGESARDAKRPQSRAPGKAEAEKDGNDKKAQNPDIRESLGRGKSLGERRDQRKEDAGELQDKDNELSLDYFATDPALLELRSNATGKFYQQIKPTEVWVENNYFHLPPDASTVDLTPLNRFWIDWAQAGEAEFFLSTHFPEASRSLTEMLLVIALLDLPAHADEPEMNFVERALSLTSKAPAILFHQQVREAKTAPGNTTILVSENFFQKNDRFRQENNLQYDKFIESPFSTHVLYGAQVVITNPTSTPQIVDLLVQVPEGALATSGTQETRTIQLELPAFNSTSFEYYFYFPNPGDFTHFPAHVNQGDQVLAHAVTRAFNVIDAPTPLDTQSWTFVSQNGTPEEVLERMRIENLAMIDLSKIAFRMSEPTFFKNAIEILRKRHVYNRLLWSYSLKHNDVSTIREFLAQETEVVSILGGQLQSPLIEFDPVKFHLTEHHEFWPLVNIRAHSVRQEREILNARIHEQYHELLTYLSYRDALNNDEQLAIVYYLLLQDRVAEALKRFEAIDPQQLSSQLQFDYLNAYVQMYLSAPEQAQAIAARYTDYPVPLWKNRFAEISAQVAELQGAEKTANTPQPDTQAESQRPVQAPVFEFKIDNNQVSLSYENLEQVVINYYLMDAELLFSTNPFDSVNQNAFSLIRPNATETIALDKSQKEIKKELPPDFKNKNVLIEVRGGEQTKALPSYANGLNVQLIKSYGQIKVAAADDGRLLPKTYVKVYAQYQDGNIKFYKDGYTDLRGRFDYVTQSNSSTEGIQKFALFIQNDKLGTVIRYAIPPQE